MVLLQVKNALTGPTLPAFLSNLASVRYERWGTAPKAHTEAGLTFAHVCFRAIHQYPELFESNLGAKGMVIRARYRHTYSETAGTQALLGLRCSAQNVEARARVTHALWLCGVNRTWQAVRIGHGAPPPIA